MATSDKAAVCDSSHNTTIASTVLYGLLTEAGYGSLSVANELVRSRPCENRKKEILLLEVFIYAVRRHVLHYIYSIRSIDSIHRFD
mmetsp:Transcript_21553/g.59850  ORF Transcript_21553/g.59850 Transcript_21553/m.59850 type:complete len:86 (+) Transcript_21553:223-480(+)